MKEAPALPIYNAQQAPALKRETSDQSIAEIVRSVPQGTHLTAPQVFQKAQEAGLDISLSTVYRILSKLRLHGDISTIAGDRGLRYEAAHEGPDHDHLICLGCGLTIEFTDDLIRGFGKTVAQRKGYEHKSSRFDILGYCKSCKANDQARRAQEVENELTSALEAAEGAVLVLRQALELQQARKLSKVSQAAEIALDKLITATDECRESLALIAHNLLDPRAAR